MMIMVNYEHKCPIVRPVVTKTGAETAELLGPLHAIMLGDIWLLSDVWCA
jgi:hypothetical protein